MSFQYEIRISLGLANALPEVKRLQDSINSHLSTMGSERFTFGRTPLVFDLTVERELQPEEIDKMKDVLIGNLCLKFAGSVPVCESFRRKSGNVSQSAAP